MKKSILTDGRWICIPRFAELEPINVYHREGESANGGVAHPEELRNIHTLFRRVFDLNKTQGKYILRASADDYGKYYINNRYVGQGPTPGYIGSYNYNEFDITDALCEGVNEITAHVCYYGVINRAVTSGDLRSGLIAEIISPEGEVILCTDESWEYAEIGSFTSKKTVGYSTQFVEDYDSRIKLREFAPVKTVKNNGIVFNNKPSENLMIYTATPVKTEKLENGAVFYDFGSELTGTLNISASGFSGDSIRILCGEECDDSSYRVRWKMRCCCDYDETWILDDGENRLCQFDYKAFRYVALIPQSGSVKTEALNVTVRHARFDDNACTLKSDDRILEAVFNICKNGVKYGTQEVYVDCPSREKGEYSGDMTITSGSQAWLTGDVYMLEKGILEEAASASTDPGLMAVMCSGYMQEIADYSLQFPLLLLRHYSFTKDREFLASMLPVAENMREHFGKFQRSDGLLDGVNDKWNLVDWPEGFRDGYDFPMTNPIGHGVHNVINAFYVGCVLNIEQIKDILGIAHDNSGDKLAKAFNNAFLNSETGLYTDSEVSTHSSLHSNILPAFYGFVPIENQSIIADFLTGKGMVCGVYMAYFLLKALCRLGRHEEAYDLITSTGKNSWYNMVRESGTTCFEAWGKDSKWNTSLCHPWASAPVTVIIEDLLSVTPDGKVGTNYIPKKAGKFEMRIPTRGGHVDISV